MGSIINHSLANPFSLAKKEDNQKIVLRVTFSLALLPIEFTLVLVHYLLNTFWWVLCELPMKKMLACELC